MVKTVIHSAILLSFLVFTNAEIKSAKRTQSKGIQFGPSSNNLYKLTEGIDQFSIYLLQETIKETSEQNSILSPLSVWTLLSLLSEGANGETLSEMTATLRHLNKNETIVAYKDITAALSEKNDFVQLETHNDLFMTNNIQLSKDYLNLAKNVYNANVWPVDFDQKSTLFEMNKIIEKNTHGKISKAFKESDLKDALVILSNTLFFKGRWSLPFEKENTKVKPFFDSNGIKIGEVNMMSQRAPFSNRYFQELECDVIEIPYGDFDCYDFFDLVPECSGVERTKEYKPRYSMFAFVPNIKMTLNELLNRLSKTSIRNIFELMDKDPMKNLDAVDIDMPRFKMNSDVSMKDILTKMGISKAFNKEKADFTAISPYKQLVLSKVCHKALIEVTEEGTVASAVSSGLLIDRITPGKIELNKPFVYMIVETMTNTLVFTGTYGIPSLY